MAVDASLTCMPVDFVEGRWVSLQGFCLTFGAGIVGNTPYHVMPGIETILPPRPVQS